MIIDKLSQNNENRISGRERVSIYLRFQLAMCEPSSWKLYSAVKSNHLVVQLLEKFSATFYSNLLTG